MLSRSRSNQDATDPRNNTLTQVLETRSGTTNSGTQASTGQTGQRHRSDRSRAGSPDQDTPGHPRANRDETGHPDLNHRVTRPKPVITLKQHYTGQTGVGHRSDRSKAGHTSGTRRVTRPSHAGSPAFTQRQIGSPVQPTPGHPSNSCHFPRKSQHRSDRCRAPVRPVPGHLPKTCPELVQQA